MDAGEFDRRITLRRKVEADNGYSTVIDAWEELATVWAKMVPMSGKEILAAAESAAFANVRFKIRRDSLWSDLNATNRIMFEDREHDIVSVRSEGRGFFLIDAVVRGDS
jgi:SPP1 family predicted phage head-tail adaptor